MTGVIHPLIADQACARLKPFEEDQLTCRSCEQSHRAFEFFACSLALKPCPPVDAPGACNGTDKCPYSCDCARKAWQAELKLRTVAAKVLLARGSLNPRTPEWVVRTGKTAGEAELDCYLTTPCYRCDMAAASEPLGKEKVAAVPGFEADYNATRDCGFEHTSAAARFAEANEAMLNSMQADAKHAAADAVIQAGDALLREQGMLAELAADELFMLDCETDMIAMIKSPCKTDFDESDLDIQPGFEADFNFSIDCGFSHSSAAGFAAANEAMLKTMQADVTRASVASVLHQDAAVVASVALTECCNTHCDIVDAFEPASALVITDTHICRLRERVHARRNFVS